VYEHLEVFFEVMNIQKLGTFSYFYLMLSHSVN